jgi:hypothetical protein
MLRYLQRFIDQTPSEDLEVEFAEERPTDLTIADLGLVMNVAMTLVNENK